ncbi:hypothetical protein C8J47_2696 [Sphingomonas sp. PP-F2F-G114-C0414]|nr:hypothetical protein C8J47_2696 [Sphingomonas sp. PP-F2F-G114-C0414]
MRAIYHLWRDVYVTYRGDDERHRLRLAVFIAVAILIAIFAKVIDENSLAMMSVAISVLTGFTFTSLFSNNISPSADLPKPKNETDRHDIATLAILERNFKARSKFIIAVSMTSIILMVFLSISISPRGLVYKTIEVIFGEGSKRYLDVVYSYAILAWIASAFVVRATTVFMFFEVIYTFYRLSETVISVLETRGAYRDAHRG